jgi:hypothetical protein
MIPLDELMEMLFSILFQGSIEVDQANVKLHAPAING